MTNEIRSNELRIGNYVRAKSPEMKVWEEPVKVDIHYLEMFCRKIQGVNFEPIPLTEEWLLKFGFEIERPLGEDSANMNATHEKFPFKLLRTIYKTWRFHPLTTPYGFIMLEPEIRYVHQLQNLIFALVGQELEIK